MYNNKKIIISLTSWKKRISFVSKVIFNIYNQTMKPDKIILNLSEDEFPEKEKELPEDLLLLNNALNEFEIYWVKENTKAFKKVIPTIKRYFNQNCWILSIDDDYIYNSNYIDFIVKLAEQNPNNYLTPGIAGNFIHGWCAIYNPNWFKDRRLFYLNKNECDKIVSSDLWISLNLKFNNINPLKNNIIKNYFKNLNIGYPLCNIYTKIPLTIRTRECFNAFKRIDLLSNLDNS